MARKPRIALEKTAGLDVATVLLGQARIDLGVLIGNLDGQVVVQALHPVVDRDGMGKFRKHQQAHVEEGLVANHRLFDDRGHAVGPVGDLGSVPGGGEIGLAGSSVVHGVLAMGSEIEE